MKKMIKFFAISSLILCAIFITKPSVAEDPITPSPPGEHGASGNQAPAGAPIDGGLGILLTLGAAYGGRKLYIYKKEKKKAAEEDLESGS
ncbi:MAG: hypothetical protein M0P58_02400 [Bacteroidales bacterium]|nr:hypothetical protein [Bacteroidales bacterium]